MAAFQKDIASGYWEEKYKVTASKVTKQSSELVDWFKNYYTLSKAGNIVVLSYKRTQKRAYYPVLFKKICIYCILAVQLKYNSRDSLSNAKFFEEFGIGENILNKWHVSTRYLFLANRDTYSALRIDRNGVKKPYLTRIIKKIYYESGNQIKKYLDTAKKYELETFVDVFSATVTVAASVDAKKLIVNDIDAGASCFLFAFIHYKGEVKEVIVCEVDNKIAASCVCVIISNLTRNVRPYAFVENVVTHGDYRKKGYATACLNYAKQIARESNCYKMMLLTGSKKVH